ncbi:LacI family DNA-binding transcriptional regulator [Streptosporangiaceae bacterium NEAU-GS5]|nr:LacI family DNA-binding transcriptional regulator [Streptosporangiaceae bacterium NEAU-GS5]
MDSAREVKRAATIHAVAALAGVSPSTVSRALNAPELVNALTRQRVLDSAEQLGYQPNRAARSLVLGRTGSLGLIVPDIANPFFTPFVKTIQSEVREAGYALFVADTDENPAAEVVAARAMAKQVDGIILCAPRMSGNRLRSIAAHTLVVIANRQSRTAPAVTMDIGPGVRQAVTHVHSLGHRKVAFMPGPRRSWSNQQRLRFFTGACAAQGLDLIVLSPVEPVYGGGYRGADEAVAAGVSAVFAYNDLVALGVLARLGDRGIKVPDDMSVLGFDDIPMAAMMNPQLTTVQMPVNAVARAAASLLLERLDGGPSRRPSAPELATKLVIRNTTAPC